MHNSYFDKRTFKLSNDKTFCCSYFKILNTFFRYVQTIARNSLYITAYRKSSHHSSNTST